MRALFLCLLALALTVPNSVLAQPAAAVPDEPVAEDPGDELADEARDLVVSGVIRSNPTTLRERLRAVELLLNVSEYRLANEMLQTSIDGLAESNDEELSELQTEFGSAFFVRLLRVPEIRKVGSQLTRNVFAAADRAASDPQRVAKSIQESMSDDLDVRRNAETRLVQVGAAAVPGLLTELAKIDPVNTTEADNLRANRLSAAIREIGPPAVPVLIGALYAEATDLPADSHTQHWLHYASEILQPMQDPTARPHLAATGWNTTDSGTELIRRNIDNLLCDPDAVHPDEFDVIPVWTYDTAQHQLVRKLLTTTEYALYNAQRLARRLYQSQPENPAHRQRYLGTLLGWSKMEAGIDTDLAPDLERRFTLGDGSMPPVTDGELDAALLVGCRTRQIPTALAAAQLLGKMGDPARILSNGYLGLKTALRDPDPRIRFYSARAIVKMDPREAYSGAADVSNALAFAAAARGKRQVLIVHPAPAKAEFLTGLLRGLRFDAISVPNGREALRFVRTHPDLELILISELFARPSWNEITQRLAQDHHSASVPIAILAAESRRPTVDGLVARFPRAGSFPTPAGRTEMVTLLQDALPRAGHFAMPAAQRVHYAASALQAIQPLIERRSAYSFYEWDAYESALVESITIEELTMPAARVLGDLATPSAQSQLVDFASQVRQPATARKAAAAAFAKAVERSGVLLNSRQISQQYQRYNDNLNDDETTAAILSSLLDTIEKPSRTR